MRARLDEARVARLATVRPDGSPHIVPCVFAIQDDEVYTPVDRKPKRSTALQRLRNIEHEARVALLADAWDEDWERLWWVRLDGRARPLDDPSATARALELLAQKYEQYREEPPEDIVIAIRIEQLRGWRARG